MVKVLINKEKFSGGYLFALPEKSLKRSHSWVFLKPLREARI